MSATGLIGLYLLGVLCAFYPLFRWGVRMVLSVAPDLPLNLVDVCAAVVLALFLSLIWPLPALVSGLALLLRGAAARIAGGRS